ncbi:MAG TPA: sigma-54 dependent transcriptional regulator [Candidatus Binatia bacterium]|nr:sigma-54 dependent transcriptional regulator [Candidatus Binatia bacterium]
MSAVLVASNGPRGERPRRPAIVLLCCDPKAPRIVAALQVLRELGETTVGSGEDAAALIARVDADVFVAEEWIGTQDGRAFLGWAAQTRPSAVGVLLASSRSGATTAHLEGLVVLPKLVDPGTLKTVCGLALDCAALRRRLRTFELEHGERLPPRRQARPEEVVDGLECYEGLLVRSAPMRAVVRTLRELEASDVTVLIHGETGTGKELVARAIHARSRRREGPFLPVNLGAIPDGLRESELFGHVRGAFTGANVPRGGLFLGADRGCLFLDEVGEASQALQVALLRVLEEGTITPVGADRPRRVDVRVISATNKNLADLARQERFRRDLYYRLNVFPVRLPPLRERVEDVLPLASHFLRLATRDLGRSIAGIAPEARAALEAHPWEGNVRELRSVMERAALICKGGVVRAADLPFGADADAASPRSPGVPPIPEGATLRDIERQVLLRTLALADGNQSQAARILGLHESTLRFRMRRAGIGAPRRASAS